MMSKQPRIAVVGAGRRRRLLQKPALPSICMNRARRSRASAPAFTWGRTS
ncbi:hypothetical protein M8494_11885 [Serratia ureilytica]